MFLIGLIIGLILGANISLVLYALIVASKEADEIIEQNNIRKEV